VFIPLFVSSGRLWPRSVNHATWAGDGESLAEPLTESISRTQPPGVGLIKRSVKPEVHDFSNGAALRHAPRIEDYWRHSVRQLAHPTRPSNGQVMSTQAWGGSRYGLLGAILKRRVELPDCGRSIALSNGVDH
jgi:hypothetical protein